MPEQLHCKTAACPYCAVFRVGAKRYMYERKGMTGMRARSVEDGEWRRGKGVYSKRG